MFAIPGDMASGRPSPAYDRVVERRRAVALARHFREAEGLSIAQIADRLGRSPATVKAYFYDPTGEKARAVKARYVGRVPRLRRLHPAAQRQGRRLRVLQGLPPGAIQRRWTRERVLGAMREWRDRYGRLPSSYDWSRTHARRRGGERARATQHRRLALRRRRDRRLRELEGGTGGGRQPDRPGWRRWIVAGASFLTTCGRPGGEVIAIADGTRATVQETAAQIGIQGRKRCT